MVPAVNSTLSPVPVSGWLAEYPATAPPAPASPFLPFLPFLPVSPPSPVPLAPASPLTPAAPVLPAGPAAPAGPGFAYCLISATTWLLLRAAALGLALLLAAT